MLASHTPKTHHRPVLKLKPSLTCLIDSAKEIGANDMFLWQAAK